MASEKSTSPQLMVIWQSLVVKSYRSFFYRLSELSKMKLGLVTPEEFSELGFQKILCEPFDHRPGVFPFRLKSKVYHTQIVLFGSLMKAFRSFFDKTSPKVIFCLAEPYSVTAFAVWLKARILYGKRFHFILFSLQNIKKTFPLPLRWIQNLMFEKVDAVAILGPEQEEVIRDQGYRGKTFPFPLWFDTEKFVPLTYQDAEKQLGSMLPANRHKKKIRVGYVGAVVEQKGILDILNCLEKNQDRWNSQMEFYFVGKGDLDKEVRSRSDQCGKDTPWIFPLGFVPHKDMGAFFSYLDVLLVPSRTKDHWKEQFGRVIVEAQACGCLVIGSDSGHIPHLLDQRFCFPEGDVAKLTDCIDLAIREVGENSLGVKKHNIGLAAPYSDQSLAKDFQNQLNEILG